MYIYRATKTDVLGVGSDLPFAMAALSNELGLQFPLLSDSLLRASDAFVGTLDLGVAMPEAFGAYTQMRSCVHIYSCRCGCCWCWCETAVVVLILLLSSSSYGRSCNAVGIFSG